MPLQVIGPATGSESKDVDLARIRSNSKICSRGLVIDSPAGSYTIKVVYKNLVYSVSGRAAFPLLATQTAATRLEC